MPISFDTNVTPEVSPSWLTAQFGTWGLRLSCYTVELEDEVVVTVKGCRVIQETFCYL